MKSSNPYAARVVAEIDINQAVAAIEHFAANYPEDRQSDFIAHRVLAAAKKIHEAATIIRVSNPGLSAEKAAPVFSVIGPPTTSMFPPDTFNHGVSVFPPDTFNYGGCVSGRIDSSKENHGNTPKEASSGKSCFGGASAPDDDGLLCRECYTWSNKNEERHQKTCSRRKQ